MTTVSSDSSLPPMEQVAGPGVPGTLPTAHLPHPPLRFVLVERARSTGGRLGPSPGAVDLPLALHRVFDSRRDALAFGTGHQANGHKLITGRAGEPHAAPERRPVPLPHPWRDGARPGGELAGLDRSVVRRRVVKARRRPGSCGGGGARGGALTGRVHRSGPRQP